MSNLFSQLNRNNNNKNEQNNLEEDGNADGQVNSDDLWCPRMFVGFGQRNKKEEIDDLPEETEEEDVVGDPCVFGFEEIG